MKRFKKILTALTEGDSARAALSWARRVAAAAEAREVEVLLVDPDPANWVPEFGPGEAEKARRQRRIDLSEEVSEALQGLEGLSLRAEVGVGAALPTILHRLARGGDDLVVVGAGSEADRRLAEKLARKSPASVLSVPAGAADRCGRILAATDLSEPSLMALEVASAFGRAFGSTRLDCLHSYAVPDYVTRIEPGGGSVREGYAAAAVSHVEALLRKSPRPLAPFRVVTREAPLPSTGILAQLRDEDYDLVVMATRGRNAVSSALLGSNTAEVIRRASVPVLSVKAKGEGLSVLRSLLGRHETAPSPTPS